MMRLARGGLTRPVEVGPGVWWDFHQRPAVAATRESEVTDRQSLKPSDTRLAATEEG